MILFPLFLSFISISISVFVSVSLSHSIVSCVHDAKSFMCYSSFSLFSVRLWLLFLLSVDALECVWCNGNRYVDLIQTHHFLYESACFVCVTAKNFPHDAFDDCKTSCALTHTHTHAFSWKECYLFAHYFKMHPHYYLFHHNDSKKGKPSGFNDTSSLSILLKMISNWKSARCLA